MVTNKTSAIRIGLTNPWSSQISAANWYQYHLNIRIKRFLEKFFGDKFYQNRGISFSHVLLKFHSNVLHLEVFLHDSKLYDFFNTKPSRRAIRIVKKKKISKKFLRNFFKRVKKYNFFSKHFSKKFRFKPKLIKRSFQPKFALRSSFPFVFRKKFSKFRKKKFSKFRKNRKFKSFFYQTMEKKFRSNRSFKSRFHNVRKFVKLSRKIFNRFKKSKFRFFKPIKNKRSKRSFKFAKLNYFLSKRRTLSNSFLIKKRFKKFKRFSKKFKPKSKHKRFYRPKKKFNYHKKWPYYSQKTPPKPKKLKRALSKVRKTYRKLKSKILKRFKRGTRKKLFFLRKSFLSNSPNFSDTAAKKRIISSYLIKRFSIYNFEKSKRNYNLRRLNKPSLRFRLKKALRLKTPARPLKKPKNKRKNRYKKYRSKHNNQKNKRNFRFFQKWKKRRIRYPFWKIRFSPIQETSKRSSQFIFFNPQNASTSSNFIRYSFYNFLGKILSFQIFKNFGLPVSIKFNLFPLHRASTDFYLNFITTKLYYRYILSDVIKPIVRLSLKFYRGFVIHCRGRFTRAQMAVSKKFIKKSVSYSKISSSIDYGQKDVVLKYGTCNLKIWIRK